MAYYGFSDASPSEVISAGSAILAVAALFPSSVNGEIAQPPVRQYKDVRQRSKAAAAKRLGEWLDEQRDAGFRMPGMVNVIRQESAARFGLELLEELPDARIEQVADSKYRLHFGARHISLGHAVALVYYWTTAHFGGLRAAKAVPVGARLIVCMDRFPGPSPGHRSPTIPKPRTAGHFFIDHLEKHTATGQGRASEMTEMRKRIVLANMSSWQPDRLALPVDAKDHPYFLLPDWLAQAATAVTFPDEFRRGIRREGDRNEIIPSMQRLRDAFGRFQIWTMDDSVFEHLRPAERQWELPAQVRDEIMTLARKSHP